MSSSKRQHGEEANGPTGRPNSELLSRDESCLLRLFRCLDEPERDDLKRAALEMLAARCSLDSWPRRPSAEDVAREIADEPDLEARVRRSWPASWDGQSIVELDNVGDAGAWLKSVLDGREIEVVLGSKDDWPSTAADLAVEYLEEIRAEGYPLPSDFGPDGAGGDGWTDSDERAVTEEFVGFLRAWRENLLTVLERQNQRDDSARDNVPG